jgi:hypothetical protein
MCGNKGFQHWICIILVEPKRKVERWKSEKVESRNAPAMFKKNSKNNLFWIDF